MKMRYRASFKSAVLVVTALYCNTAACSQAEEMSAGYFCAVQSPTGPPRNISVTSDENDGVSYLRFAVQGGVKTLVLPGVMGVTAICPVADDRVVIFGALSHGASTAYGVAVANAANGELLDSWDSYTPVMSPNQRWVILRKFYAPQTSLTLSEEYLLYPLWKVLGTAHAAADENAGSPSSATVVYPLGQTNTFMSNIGVPPGQVHVFRSRSFYWSADSRAVAFADSVRDSLNIVLVLVNAAGTTTLIHALAPQEVCDSPSSANLSRVTLAGAIMGPDEGGGGRKIELTFNPGSSGCGSKTISIDSSTFQAPTPESHPVPKRKLVSTPLQQ